MAQQDPGTVVENAVDGIQVPNTSATETTSQTPDVYSTNPTSDPSRKINVSASPISLRFPNDIGKYAIKFSFSKYQRPTIFERLKLNNTGFIALPIPANLKDSYSLNYSTKELGAAGYVFDKLSENGTNEGKSALGSLITNIEQGTGNLTDDLKNVAEKGIESAPSYGAAALAQYASGFPAGVAALQTLGLAVNPFLSVVFNNVDFKEYQFSWRFMPRDSKETQTIKKIIDEFKIRSHPTVKGSLFTIPDLVTITLDPPDHLFNFRKCVIKSISVDYAPNDLPSFFYDGAPTTIDFSIRLQEVEIRTSDNVNQ